MRDNLQGSAAAVSATLALSLWLGACAPHIVPVTWEATGTSDVPVVSVTLKLRVRDEAGKPIQCIGLYYPGSPTVPADTVPRALSDSAGWLKARLELPRGWNTVDIGSPEYSGGGEVFRVRGPGSIDLGTMTMEYHKPFVPITHAYPDCSGRDSTSIAEEALAALTEAWWPAMLQRDSVFVDTALAPDFRWVHAADPQDVPKERLLEEGLRGMPCGPGLVYELTALRARSLGREGVVTSYGTVGGWTVGSSASSSSRSSCSSTARATAG